MITNKNHANKWQCRESVRHFRERRSAARVSGKTFNSYEYAQWDTADLYDSNTTPATELDVLTECNIACLEMSGELSDDVQAFIIQSRERGRGDNWPKLRNNSAKAHHPYVWACRQSSLPVRKFAEIATDKQCIQLRAQLELARLYHPLNSKQHNHPVVVMYNHLLKKDWDRDLLGEERTAWHIKSQMLELGTEHYVAMTINLGRRLLDKHKGKNRQQLIKVMTDRIRDYQQAGKLPSIRMIFALEDLDHLHMLIFGHSSESLAPYEAAFKRVCGEYKDTNKEAAKKQLHIQEGYGFERALGWTNYLRKQSATLHEPRHITQAGKMLYLQAGEQWIPTP